MLVTAAISSIISEKPKLCIYKKNICIAVNGVLMPYRIFIANFSEILTGIYRDNKHDSMKKKYFEEYASNEILDLHKDVKIPSKYETSSPFYASYKAVSDYVASLRQGDDKRSNIMQAIKEIEEEYKDLYQSSIK